MKKIFLLVLFILLLLITVSCKEKGAETNKNSETVYPKDTVLTTTPVQDTDPIAKTVTESPNESDAPYVTSYTAPETSIVTEAQTDGGGITKLSFKSASSYQYLKKLDGKEVTINGYLATSSPVDGSFIFLMNLPFQSCPFCVPNTSELSNTMEVYPKSGKTFSYTDRAVKVTGILEVAESEDESFTDRYGYEFNFKIVDASYTILSSEDIENEEEKEKVTLFQTFAGSGIINEIYSMYDYLNFLCNWPEYFVNSYDDGRGNVTPGYYLYASDALRYIETEGAQWNYGYKEGYFDKLAEKVKAIDPDYFKVLTDNIQSAKVLAEKAFADLKGGKYSYEKKYVEKFGTEDYVFTLNNKDELMSEWEKLFYSFTDWFGSFEM